MLAGLQQPFEVFLLFLSVLTGAAFLSGVRPPTSLEHSLDHWVVQMWFSVLVLSGVIGLCGCFWPGNIVTGLLLERSAMLLAVAAGLIYAMGLLASAGWGAVGTAASVIAYILACLVRIGGITATLNRLYRLGG